MDQQGREDKTNEISVTDSRALAKRSASIARRGLLNLSIGELERLLEIGKALTSRLGDVVTILSKKAAGLLPSDRWSLLLMDEDKQELHFQIVSGKDVYVELTGHEAATLYKTRIKPGEGIIGWAVQSREAVVVPDVRLDSRFLAELDGVMDPETRSLVAVPMLVGNQCLGVLVLVNWVGAEGASPTALFVFRTLADFTAIAIKEVNDNLAIYRLTTKDEATGLYNVRKLNSVLDVEIFRSQRYGLVFSLVVVDIEDFATLSGSVSWRAINQLLADLGGEIDVTRRRSDYAFYLGNGRFVMLLPAASNEDSREDARKRAQQLHGLLEGTIWLTREPQPRQLTFSVDVLTFPEDGGTKADLLHALDKP